jgi:hypothetical protein
MFDAGVNAAKKILKLGHQPNRRTSGVACESSQNPAGSSKENARESGSSAFQGREYYLSIAESALLYFSFLELRIL